MRLDLFLKASRLCLRRTVAQKMCEAGLVLVNGGVAKSATTIKVGDEIVLRRGEHVTKVRVVSMPATRQTSRIQAGTLYEFVDETSD